MTTKLSVLSTHMELALWLKLGSHRLEEQELTEMQMSMLGNNRTSPREEIKSTLGHSLPVSSF